MILGIGTDIVSVDRFRNSKTNMNHFAEKILTDYELVEYNKSDDPARYIAKKWATKEAIAKAWGTGIAGETKFKSIEVRHNQSGQPVVCFLNKLKDSAETLSARCHLSISDEGDTVVAYSIVEYKIN
jgi:holo-[acyl-carrier protein] synthase